MVCLEPIPSGEMENYTIVDRPMTVGHYIDFPKKLQKYFSKAELSDYDILSDLLKGVTSVLFWEITFLANRESEGLQVGIFFYKFRSEAQRNGKAEMKLIHQAILETAIARVVASNKLLENTVEPLLQRFPYDIALKIAKTSLPSYHQLVKVEEKSWDY